MESAVNDLIAKNNIRSVIEFGCGDGNQLRLFHCEQYLGLDVSVKAIEMNRKKYADDSAKTFQLLHEFSGPAVELTLSLDVIYHLIEDDVFHQYMESLFAASTQFVCIYASNKNDDQTMAVHVKHRKFTDWIDRFCKDWKCIEHIPNKYPFDPADDKETSFADFYIFEKMA